MSRRFKGAAAGLVSLALVLCARPAGAWDDVGHRLVARIAWEQLSSTTRHRIVALLNLAPSDACLLDLAPANPDPQIRDRGFFAAAATWSDVIRKRDQTDTRPCTKYSRPSWHFINLFWQGISGTTGSTAPKDRPDIHPPEMNIVDRLKYLRPFVVCSTPACGAPDNERAMAVAWILHLAGDIQQPLHDTDRITTAPGEQDGDQGGNLFKLGTGQNPPSLHSLWDHIIDDTIARQPSETDAAYLDRVAHTIMTEHPPAQLASQIKSADYDAWAQEGLDITKASAYPASLNRNQPAPATYKTMVFTTAKTRIALGGYRLADLLTLMFGV